jgi:hypothetical protein
MPANFTDGTRRSSLACCRAISASPFATRSADSPPRTSTLLAHLRGDAERWNSLAT